ncbi:MAG TPA: UDP-N-acetylglucosamine--N-acetylmuramyl-(pentapeptide) pyrophosphoryl-undecaprenol N-acetylglucosamine transferase [Tepidisphaeraceae bacterium]|jgi:UDP-N-acetylglucosamine--N-acetylmuramyl-(pentapeptide) pyrophosphoryl-undecaprenol N-acetylglucosamine transferase|nr:UDP-N-acetylglucosamine--N-acetylmuramyl-(pentapeptide) pyrophosphoryl-undecaprenol N-acetylglucosamine transferase [Tepidisphaeraceae bacterium]
MGNATTILFAGGGTGGHLFPGIAVAEALRTVMPDARPLFLCTQKEIDRIILEPTGFEFIPQPIIPPVKTIGGLLKFWKSWRETKDLVRGILKDRAPIAALGLGGYAAGVAIREAAGKKVPAALINPDVIPGKANQFLVKNVQAICCQFAETAEHIAAAERGKVMVTGCPIRSEIRALPPRDEAIKRLSLDPRLLTLAVTGASLGAKTVNEAVLTMLEGVGLRGWQVLHLSGREHADAVRAEYRALADRGTAVAARVIDFTPAMADIWAVTDLAVSRSGASSCAELTACGVPSILLPYPFHKDMHQRLNAKVLADAGAAVLVDDEKDRRKNADKLRPALEQLLYDADKRAAMACAAKKLGHPDAAENVAKVVMNLATKPQT